MSAPPAPPPLSRNRDFLLLWVGQATSTLGTRASSIAYPLLVLAIAHSPAQAGLAGFAATLPYLVLQLPAGVWMDRWNRRRAMIIVDVVRCLTLASVAVATLAGVVTVPQIVAAAFLEGCMSALFMAGEPAAIAHVVAPSQVPEALARNEARTRGAGLAGPPVGGLLFGLARSLPFAFDAATYAVSVATLGAVRREFQASPAEPAARRAVWAEMREGLGWLWRQPLLRDSALLVAGSNMLFQALVLVVIVLARHEHAGAGQVGLVLAGGGAGGVLGALAAPAVQRRVHPRTVVIGCNWVWAALFPLFALGGGPLELGIVFGACAAVGPLWNVVLGAYAIALVPDGLRSRVASAELFLAFGAIPLGSLGAGLLLSTVSTTASVLVLSAVMLCLAVAATADPAVRHAPDLGGRDRAGGEADGGAAGSIR